MMQFDITTDIDSGKVDLDRLQDEIVNSNLPGALEYLRLTDNILTIKFDIVYTTEQEAQLAALIKPHSGLPYPEESIPQQVVNTNYAFAEKVTIDGKKLFRRKHGIAPKVVAAGQSATLELTVPYAQCKINKLEIIGGNNNDQIDFFILDSEQGMIQQSMGLPPEAITPWLPLNQFGYNVCISKDYYADESNYDAELYGGMVVHMVFYNRGDVDVKVGINVTLHEMR